MREGVDFSSSKRPDIKAFDASPIRNFVVRYVSYLGNTKNITKPEADFWRKNGIDIAIVFESSSGRAKMGSAAGKADAVAARNGVARAGGPKDGGVIYFAVDFPATREDQGMINGYFEGIRTVLDPANVGAYGSHDVIARLVDAKLITWKFQTYAWSGGIEYPDLHLFQYQNDVPFGGTMVDFDRAYTANFGQWDYEDDGEFVMDNDAKAAFKALSDKVDGLGAYVMNRRDDLPAHAGLTDIYDVVRKIEDLVRAPFSDANAAKIQSYVMDGIKQLLNIRQQLELPSDWRENDKAISSIVAQGAVNNSAVYHVHQALDSHAGNLVTKIDSLAGAVEAPGPAAAAAPAAPPVDLTPVLAALTELRGALDKLPKTDATQAVAAILATSTKLERQIEAVAKDLAAVPRHDVPKLVAAGVDQMRSDLASLTLAVAPKT